MSKPTKIIILNGVGSAGKSTIAKALQEITVEPFLHVQMDAFLEMMPETYANHPDSFSYETLESGWPSNVVINTGPFGAKVMDGMRHAIAALAARGNNLIVDEVMLEGEAAIYADLLAGFDLSFVGVFAPLEILEERERSRDDRMTGLARWQFDQVHHDITYDLEVDTGNTNPAGCAKQIKQALKL